MIKFNEYSLFEILNGMNLLNKAVSSTLGPYGRRCIIGEEGELPHITKDGVTVANSIFSENIEMQMGIDLLRQTARETCKEAGDGTTTSTIIAYKLISECVSLIATKKVSILDCIYNLEILENEFNSYIKDYIIPIDTQSNKLENIATISANNDSEIGKMVADGYKKITKHGIIDIADSIDNTTYLELSNGVSYHSEMIDPRFKNDFNDLDIRINNPIIALFNTKITNYEIMVPILNFAKEENRSIVVMATDFDNSVINFLLENKTSGILDCYPIKTPGLNTKRISNINDISVYTGCKIREMEGREFLCGEADSIAIKELNIIINKEGGRKNLKELVDSLLEKKKATNIIFEKEALEKRISNLTGGVAVIHVGGYSDAEIKEKKDRIDDAIKATKSSLINGCIVGGGTVPYLIGKRIENNNDDKSNNKYVKKAFIEAINAPLFKLISIVELDKTNFEYEKMTKEGIGFNFNTLEFTNLKTLGILDSSNIIVSAINNAVSLAKSILTINTLIIKKSNEKNSNIF